MWNLDRSKHSSVKVSYEMNNVVCLNLMALSFLRNSTKNDRNSANCDASDNSETGLACGLPVVPLSVGNVSVPPNG